MRALVEQARERLLSAKDTVCLQRARLVTEAYRRHENDPPPLRRARAFAYVLAHMDLDIDSNPVFAGNTSSRPRGWMLIPEHGFGVDRQIALENDGLDAMDLGGRAALAAPAQIGIDNIQVPLLDKQTCLFQLVAFVLN